MNSFDAVGFGALNVDKLFKVNEIAMAEMESFVQTQSVTCGGSAANTIVGLARLGCKVGFLGKVANDREGELLLEDFSNENVDTAGVVRVRQGSSGKVMGFVDKKGARALYIDSGVNDTITLSEVKMDYVLQAKFLHLTSFVGPQSFQTQKRILQTLPENVKISFDPGALYAKRGFPDLEPIIRKCHVTMPNAIELEQMSGKLDFRDGAEFLLAKGVGIVAVKLGKDGCYVTNGVERHLVEPFKVEAVDTTGAGDAFCAGFLYGLLKQKNLFDCGKIGNFVGSRCVMRMGAREGLPYSKDLAVLS